MFKQPKPSFKKRYKKKEGSDQLEPGSNQVRIFSFAAFSNVFVCTPRQSIPLWRFRGGRATQKVVQTKAEVRTGSSMSAAGGQTAVVSKPGKVKAKELATVPASADGKVKANKLANQTVPTEGRLCDLWAAFKEHINVYMANHAIAKWQRHWWQPSWSLPRLPRMPLFQTTDSSPLVFLAEYEFLRTPPPVSEATLASFPFAPALVLLRSYSCLFRSLPPSPPLAWLLAWSWTPPLRVRRRGSLKGFPR